MTYYPLENLQCSYSSQNANRLQYLFVYSVRVCAVDVFIWFSDYFANSIT